jgi:hypothetical protein
VTYREVLQRFGLPASNADRAEIRRLLAEEIERERDGESGDEMLRLLSAQLFSLGVVEDVELIWEAKSASFDAGSIVDVQFLCGGGGVEATKAYLAGIRTEEAAAALRCIEGCERAGDFSGWSPEKWLDVYHRYYGLAS